MATTFTVLYDDGRSVVVRKRPWDETQAEALLGASEDAPVAAGYKIALMGLIREGHEPPGTKFDDWIGRVYELSADVTATGPTVPAASNDGLSNSPSQPTSRTASSSKKTTAS